MIRAIAPTKSPCLPHYCTPTTVYFNPWTPEKTLFLAAHRHFDPDGQKHTLQLAATEVVKVVGWCWPVCGNALVPHVTYLVCQLQRTWVYHSLLPWIPGQHSAQAEATGSQMCLAKPHIAGCSDSLHNILGTE